MFDDESFFRAPGRYPDRISASVRKGLRTQIKTAATAQNVPPSEFIRNAIELRVSEVLGQPTPERSK
jgi:hypothetical protein